MSRHVLIHGEQRHLGGWHRDQPDHRDQPHTARLLAAQTLAPLPPSYDGHALRAPIRDQGDEGSCTGHGWRGAFMSLALKLKGPHYPDRSPQFIYDMERRIDGVPLTEDSGAQIRDGAKALFYYGAAGESFVPYGPANFGTMPSHAAMVDGAAHKIVSYYRLPDLTAIKRSIVAGYPVVFGFTCFESLQSDAVAVTGDIPYPQPDEADVGGHCMLWDSYDDSRVIGGEKGALIGPNSWGGFWGKSGCFAMPYRYVTDGLAADFWCIRNERL